MNFIKSALGLPWLVCAARLVYMSRLYRKTSTERRFHVQVSPIWPIIRPIPEDLSIKPRPDTHFGAQVRLVHHGIIWKRAKEPPPQWSSPSTPIHSRAEIMKYPRASRIQGAVGIVGMIVYLWLLKCVALLNWIHQPKVSLKEKARTKADIGQFYDP